MYLLKECNGTYSIKDIDGSYYYGDAIEIGLTLRDLGVSWEDIERSFSSLYASNYNKVFFDMI